MSAKPRIQFLDLEKKAYAETLEFQTTLFNQLLQHKKEKLDSHTDGYFILVEHLPVYTIGRNGSTDNVLFNPKNEKAEVIRIGRGGDITYHGPGQVVGYPILNLEKWPLGLAKYVFLIEETIILTLGDYGIEADRTKEAPGVWIDFSGPDARKIAAIGIQSSRWVTMHGFAFNINTDLDYFNHIIPCGIPDKKVTSLSKELGREVALNEVKEKLRYHFHQLFNVDWVDSGILQDYPSFPNSK